MGGEVVTDGFSSHQAGDGLAADRLLGGLLSQMVGTSKRVGAFLILRQAKRRGGLHVLS